MCIRDRLKAVETGKITEADVDARLDELLTLVFDTHACLLYTSCPRNNTRSYGR